MYWSHCVASKKKRGAEFSKKQICDKCHNSSVHHGKKISLYKFFLREWRSSLAAKGSQLQRSTPPTCRSSPAHCRWAACGSTGWCMLTGPWWYAGVTPAMTQPRPASGAGPGAWGHIKVCHPPADTPHRFSLLSLTNWSNPRRDREALLDWMEHTHTHTHTCIQIHIHIQTHSHTHSYTCTHTNNSIGRKWLRETILLVIMQYFWPAIWQK